MAERVTVSISEDGVADVRLSRPDKLNALDDAMFSGLIETGVELAHSASLRAVVLSGEGRCFCAGLDMASFAAMTEDAPAPRRDDAPRGLLGSSGDSPATRAQRAAWVWRELPVPVIAAIHGVAYGGGLQIALAADLRIVTPDARLSVMEIKWGLIPDMTATQTLRHLVRLDVAKELTFTGRVVSGIEAEQLGLATQVSDEPRETALALAAEIASKSPNAIRAAKTLLDQTSVASVEDGLRLEAKLQAGLIAKPNQIEAVKSNLEKRRARFKDPE